MKHRNILGQNIREFRKKAGMSQKTLANALKKDQANISRIEKGIVIPSIDTVFRISFILNITVWEFFLPQDERAKIFPVEGMLHQERYLFLRLRELPVNTRLDVMKGMCQLLAVFIEQDRICSRCGSTNI